ncbi:hypothetical protein FVEN_g9510 [Fusarium venenatum]|uniref:DOMON domain-containing protein n=1 Tax=Fusarium venenatum TaxID=56646 RepID=A0A2L2TPE9_9HYPO|nr:uncharacterized protein FVRRES_04203 [Fusarium venenatum]KAG8352348.1 hypothetical protein FVEN_g9510 [Fusarium venenatum]KAH7002842.1 hypothetical protein EDB82DRAFT_531361 [Fusarium venenatum]CEI67691.1 unnamed protein product [Fusarium venenatum]
MRASDFAKAALPAFATYVAAAKNSGPFSLYAYGPDVGGLSLFSAGDAIYVGNFSRLDDVQAAPIQFTFSNNELKASPNTTDLPGDKHPTWSNKPLVIPGPSSASKTVKMVNSTANTSNYISDFMFYGSFFMAEESGEMLSLWYRQDTDIEGVYTVGWNASTSAKSDEVVPLTLKRTAPSNPSN